MSSNPKKAIRGRAATLNPVNRFETIHIEPDPEYGEDTPQPITVLLQDHSKSLITYNDSPDTGFYAGINPYRGCEHGCIYCFARPNHEFLGYSCGIDFESKIVVKRDAAQILRKELSARKYKPQVIVMSGNTDPYQPIERKLKITRQCLEVFAEFRNPVAFITKNKLILRDLDLLKELNQYHAVGVFVSVTTLDPHLARIMEPRASRPKDRLNTIEQLNRAGIPVGTMVAPVIPGLTDQEIPAILKATRAAGAQSANYILVRLPHAVKVLFEDWLEQNFPEKKDKVLNRIRAVRKGKLNDPGFGSRIVGDGIFAEQIQKMFTLYRNKYDFPKSPTKLSTEFFRKDGGKGQILLFE